MFFFLRFLYFLYRIAPHCVLPQSSKTFVIRSFFFEKWLLIILYLFKVSVNYIIVVRCTSCISCTLSSALCSCCASCLCLLVNLAEECLCAVHQFFLASLDFINLCIGHLVDRSFVDSFFQCI